MLLYTLLPLINNWCGVVDICYCIWATWFSNARNTVRLASDCFLAVNSLRVVIKAVFFLFKSCYYCKFFLAYLFFPWKHRSLLVLCVISWNSRITGHSSTSVMKCKWISFIDDCPRVYSYTKRYYSILNYTLNHIKKMSQYQPSVCVKYVLCIYLRLLYIDINSCRFYYFFVQRFTLDVLLYVLHMSSEFESEEREFVCCFSTHIAPSPCPAICKSGGTCPPCPMESAPLSMCVLVCAFFSRLTFLHIKCSMCVCICAVVAQVSSVFSVSWLTVSTRVTSSRAQPTSSRRQRVSITAPAMPCLLQMTGSYHASEFVLLLVRENSEGSLSVFSALQSTVYQFSTHFFLQIPPNHNLRRVCHW